MRRTFKEWVKYQWHPFGSPIGVPEFDEEREPPGYWRKGKFLSDKWFWVGIVGTAAFIWLILPSNSPALPRASVQYDIQPLAEPFSSLIPDAPAVSTPLQEFNGRTVASSSYGDDGSAMHSRYLTTTDERAFLAMTISELASCEDSHDYVFAERSSRFCEESDILLWADRLNLPPEDVGYRLIFYREPNRGVQGEETLYFCLENNVAEYMVWILGPPKLSDGYFMPRQLTGALERAACHTLDVWNNRPS